jgi:hypothetical protein
MHKNSGRKLNGIMKTLIDIFWRLISWFAKMCQIMHTFVEILMKTCKNSAIISKKSVRIIENSLKITVLPTSKLQAHGRPQLFRRPHSQRWPKCQANFQDYYVGQVQKRLILNKIRKRERPPSLPPIAESLTHVVHLNDETKESTPPPVHLNSKAQPFSLWLLESEELNFFAPERHVMSAIWRFGAVWR